MKPLELFSLLPRRPGEFLERASAILASRWEGSFGGRAEYQTVGAKKGIMSLLGNWGAEEALNDATLAQVEARVKQRKAELPGHAPFARFHNGDTLLGRLCYAAARLLRPEVVVETGVCYGVTSAYLLAALEANGKGHLHSIDLPPLGKNGDDYVGWLVPNDLRNRWTLQRGSSGRLLGPLIARLGAIDLFIHDSLHTYKNMKREFDTAWPALRAGGILLSDDVEGNEAFQQLAARPDVAKFVVLREDGKNALLGAAVKRG